MLAWFVDPQVLEGVMLFCFGVSWPVAILKTWRTRRTEGKSFAFLVMVFVGYLAGTAAKLFRAHEGSAWPEPVTILYVLNGAFVATDMCLYLRYRPKVARAAG